METVFLNPFLLAGAGAIAWGISAIFEKIDRKLHPTVKVLRNDIYTYKCKRLHDVIFNYYYTLTQIDPVKLSYDLASKDLNFLKRKKLINKKFESLRETDEYRRNIKNCIRYND